jgi:hypothetical protein
LAPEQKPRPSPVSTTARAPPSPDATLPKASASSITRSSPAAFIVEGSLRVIVATPLSTAYLILA